MSMSLEQCERYWEEAAVETNTNLHKNICVNFVFATQFAGGVIAQSAILPKDSTDEEIKNLFPKILGIPYDDNCFFERLEENKNDK